MNALLNTIGTLIILSTLGVFVLFLYLFNEQIKEYWEEFKKELDE